LLGVGLDELVRRDDRRRARLRIAATTAELLAREPDVPQRQFDHAQSLYWVGFIAWQRGDLGAAKRQFQGYDALASKLVAADPRKFDWQLEKSYAQSNLGTVASESGDLAAASRHFAAALVIDRRFYEANRTLDDAIMQYGETLSWAARVAALRDEFARAEVLYGQGVALYRQALAADPKNQALLTKLTIITTQHARALNDLGRTEEARPVADEAIALATAMSARDRSNAQAAEYQRNAQLLAAQLAKDARDHATAARLAGGRPVWKSTMPRWSRKIWRGWCWPSLRSGSATQQRRPSIMRWWQRLPQNSIAAPPDRPT
jgi:tetratricopeptide (TPR) repeat protein